EGGWRGMVEEAARQSGRADVPAVEALRPLGEAVRALDAGVRLLILDEDERSTRLAAAAGDGSVALVVGPEGGLAREEVEELRGAGGGARLPRPPVAPTG